MNFLPSAAKQRRASVPPIAEAVPVSAAGTIDGGGAGGLGSFRDISVPAALPRGRERRRTPRYLCELQTACVVISLVEPVLLSAGVRDLAQVGIGLLLPSRVQPGGFLAIKLQGPREPRPRIMRARVVRTVTQPDRRSWFHGCEFVGELQREEVANLL